MIAPLRTTLAAMAALALSGCVSLLPEAEPAQLYRLDAAIDTDRLSGGGEAFGVVLPDADFARAAGGDRILTVNEAEVAYIAEARWIAPASVLFEEALSRAFDVNPGAARLVTRGEYRQAEDVLRIDVRRFEAVYDRGEKAAPKVVVRVRATLVSREDRSLVAERIFETESRASANRVSSIVEAFDAASAEVLTDLVDWTNRRGGAAS